MRVIQIDTYYWHRGCCCPQCLTGYGKWWCIIEPRIGGRDYLVRRGEYSYHKEAAKLFCCEEDAVKFLWEMYEEAEHASLPER